MSINPNLCICLGHTTKLRWAKPANGIPHLDNRISSDNTYINKEQKLCKCKLYIFKQIYQSQRVSYKCIYRKSLKDTKS